MTTMTTTMTTSSRRRRRTRSGAGLAWAITLGVISAALIYIFKRPVADVLLGDPEDENLVALAGLLSGAMLVFKIADITLWLERRPAGVPDRRYVAAAARPRGADRVPRHRLRGRGGDPRHPGRHRGRGHRRPRPAHRQLRAELRHWRGQADHPARSLPGADRDVVLADPERRHLHPLALRRATTSSASTTSPRGSASSSRSSHRASAWGCGRFENRRCGTPSRSSTASRRPAVSCSPTSA